ncbi:MAG: hypothetical protein ACREOW_03880 [Thermodesulfobacteriota bacterium]
MDGDGVRMPPNLDRYKKHLDSLLVKGDELNMAMQAECLREQVERALKKQYGDKAKKILKAFPSFAEAYQPWYSEAKVLVRQLLPDQLSDFVRHYEKPKPAQAIEFRRSSGC